MQSVKCLNKVAITPKRYEMPVTINH